MHHGCEINFLFMIKMKMIAKYPCRADGRSENPEGWGWGNPRSFEEEGFALIYDKIWWGNCIHMLSSPGGPALITLSIPFIIFFDALKMAPN